MLLPLNSQLGNGRRINIYLRFSCTALWPWQEMGLLGRDADPENGSQRASDSWPKVVILLVCQICFLKYIWRLSFVLTNFFFFSGNTTHPEVSSSKWLCGEDISNKGGPELCKQSHISLKGYPLGSSTLCQSDSRAPSGGKANSITFCKYDSSFSGSQLLQPVSFLVFFLIKQTISGFPFQTRFIAFQQQ